MLNIMTVADLHIHTTYSPDSTIDPLKLYERAKKLGLDVICITDHNVFEDSSGVESIQDPGSKPIIIKGVELATDSGEILVFGLKNDFWKKTLKNLEVLPPLKKVLNEIENMGAVAIWAHPFRRYSSMHYGTDLNKFHQIKIIEALNGNNSEYENELAKEFAVQNKYKQVGGSDAHTINDVGKKLTLFDHEIKCSSDLVEALRTSNYRPITMSDLKSKDLSRLIK